MLRYLGRLVCYTAIFFVTFSVSYVLVLRVVPVTITPLKLINMFDKKPASMAVYSKWRSLNRIDRSMTLAAMASEDSRFMEHNGFDWKAIREAMRHNRRSERIRGGSTISQQTAKNVFCSHNRTYIRKAFEGYYTILIETLWSKRRIMEVYLNIIETRRNVYGVEATAQRFFNKKASELNSYDASMIATILPSPNRMNLARPSKYMQGRAARIRAAMNNMPPVKL
ncbi:MAG: monofunctional biosynthetic peptidoglycan transglycosylase [Rikenellaceae bacterium]|jgi:monofunctional biosynthetic peptidoglycan transglycosylase|nr:monofunctional biosynthetic peptidoglycan transglycosylase [Rikenellaceae bacterium]